MNVGDMGSVAISDSCNLQNCHFGKINIGRVALLAREKEDGDGMSPER